MRVLIDTNVVIDVLQRREPWYDSSLAVLHMVSDDLITGCLTAKQLADIHYVSKKLFKGRPLADMSARSIISVLCNTFEIIDTLADDCVSAIDINNNDYEDAILMVTAARHEVDYIVTRNTKHFAQSSVPVSTPAEFLQEDVTQ